MGWTCLHQHPQHGEWKGEEQVNSLVKRRKSLTHYCCGQNRIGFQNWKYFITSLVIGSQRRQACKHFAKRGEKEVSQTDITPAPLLLTSMPPLPSCHCRLHPVPLVRQKAAQGLEVTKEWLLSAAPWFPCFLCTGREKNPNAIMLCLFYLNLSHTLTANRCICFPDWWRPCN